MGCLGCLLWPFRLVWGIVGAILGVIGSLLGGILGFVALVVGVILVFSLVSAFAWIPLLIIGVFFIARAASHP